MVISILGRVEVRAPGLSIMGAFQYLKLPSASISTIISIISKEALRSSLSFHLFRLPTFIFLLADFLPQWAS